MCSSELLEGWAAEMLPHSNWLGQLKEICVLMWLLLHVFQTLFLLHVDPLFWRYQVCLKAVFWSWITEELEFKCYCWWELLLFLMGHTEGSRSRLNEILERANEAPGVMKSVMIWQCRAQILILSSIESLSLTNGRGLKGGGGENKIFADLSSQNNWWGIWKKFLTIHSHCHIQWKKWQID